MSNPKITGAQRDFSAGELDVALKRADENPAMKTGARQLANWRILSSGQASQRPGRRALFQESGRVEEILMSPGNVFYLVFGVGYVRIYNAAGARVFNSAVTGDGSRLIPWTAQSIHNVSFDIVPLPTLSIFIAYADGAPNNAPQVLTWDGVSQTSTWTLTTFAETVTVGGRKDTVFTRISKQDVTMLPSGISGAITLTFSDHIAKPGMVGTRFLFCGRQVLVTGYADDKHLNATAVEVLPQSQVIPFYNDFADTPINGTFSVGDLVSGSVSGANAVVTSWAPAANPYPTLTVQLIPSSSGGILSFFQSYTSNNDIVVGPNGSAKIQSTNNATISSGNPLAVATWDDEVMNLYRGYPANVFYDQNRLGFCNFPALPSGIGWSYIGLPYNFLVMPIGQSITAANAIFEFAPGKSQVYFVVAGMESSEFVFCDNAVYYIPITSQSPLAPGSVAFNLLSKHGSAPYVQPKLAEQSILYLRAGGGAIGAVQAQGAYFRPYVVDVVSELHSHLFTVSPVIAIAVPSQSTQFEEKYAYMLRADGVVLCGRYSMKGGLFDVGQDGKPKIGWLRWTGIGFTTWISAQGGDLILTTTYYNTSNIGDGFSSDFSGNFGNMSGSPVYIVEVLDATQYLDAAIVVNAAPSGLAPPSGSGPLWMFANGTVTLMDNGIRPMGRYSVDATGNLIPQNSGGENLSSPYLVAGQPWLSVLEPFCPDAQPGNSVHQRMFKRRISRMAVYVSSSTGFVMARLFSQDITPTSPPYGTVMSILRIPAWNQDDDATQPPPQREQAYRWRPLGRAFDPRVAIIKDTPGPIIVHELGIEATI